MALFKKTVQQPDYEPLLHMAETIEIHRSELVTNEVKSLEELRLVQSTFYSVLEQDAVLKEKMDSFGRLFEQMQSASEGYAKVKEKTVKKDKKPRRVCYLYHRHRNQYNQRCRNNP